MQNKVWYSYLNNQLSAVLMLIHIFKQNNKTYLNKNKTINSKWLKLINLFNINNLFIIHLYLFKVNSFSCIRSRILVEHSLENIFCKTSNNGEIKLYLINKRGLFSIIIDWKLAYIQRNNEILHGIIVTKIFYYWMEHLVYIIEKFFFL